MPIHHVTLGHNHKPIKIWASDIEAEAAQQLWNLTYLPFIYKHIAAMPDVHLGKGATVGSVIATIGAIIPAAVGVDLGCGMNAVRLSLKANQLPDNLQPIYDDICKLIPLGAGGAHQKPHYDLAKRAIHNLNGQLYAADVPSPLFELVKTSRWVQQLGTLGSGNHFIELCLDENDYVWIMLHSGSRGIGNAIGRYFIEKAKEEMRRWFINLPDQNLAYLPEGSQHYDDYCEALAWAGDYATENRRLMMQIVLGILFKHIPLLSHVTEEAVDCHHNYVARENHFGENVWITRKGAVRARAGDLGIIPGSMGAKSYIVRGLGNPDSFCSCSHGAGRKMSRSEAARRFTADDLAAQTRGILCPKTANFVDEIPDAYKPIDQVMADQTDLVEKVHTLTQVLNVKG